MNMYYDGTLVMPSNYVVMYDEEMTYVDGGVNSLPMKKKYLNKSTCKSVALNYITATKLSQLRIAKEIYAHAVMYYASTATIAAYAITLNPIVGACLPILNYIHSHAKSVEIGGDSEFRVKVYNAIWDTL